MPIQFTRANKLMDECLREVEDYWAREKARLAALCSSLEAEDWDEAHEPSADEKKQISADALSMANLMLSDVVRHKGCYLLRSRWENWDTDPDEQFVPTERFPNRSGYEDFENHLHVADCFISKEPGIHFLIVGLALAEVVYSKLRLTFPDVHFRICVSFSVKPFEFDPEDTHVRDDCVVRFHAAREGENLYARLEQFGHDAVGILNF